MTKKAEKGDAVEVHYIGKLDDGSVFDSSRERGEPIEFTLGEHRMIPGFEDAVYDMAVGDVKEFSLNPDEAYGAKRDDLVFEIERDRLPEDMEPKAGAHLQIGQKEGPPIVVEIKDVSDDKLTLDANHPMAGKNLNFEIELMEIK